MGNVRQSSDGNWEIVDQQGNVEGTYSSQQEAEQACQQKDRQAKQGGQGRSGGGQK